MRARRRRPAPYIHLGYVLQPSPALARPQRATRGRPHRLRSTLRVAYWRSDSAHRLGHWQSARRYPVPEYLKPAPAFPERLATRKIHSAFRRTAILGREKQRQISSVRGFFSGLHCVTLETNDGGAPGQPAANDFNHDRVPARKTAIAHRLIECERNRCRSGIAVLVYGHEHMLQRQSQFAAGALHDADIRLVGNQPIDLRCAHARFIQCFKRDFLKEMDRELKNRLAVHCHKRLTAYRAAADAAGRAQNIRMAAIRMQSAGYYARLFRSLQYDRARAVAE